MPQCNNLMSLKVTNDREKSVVVAALTDSIARSVEMLPNLNAGGCVVIVDTIMLPSRIILNQPKEKPKSAMIDFWDWWYDAPFDIDAAVEDLIRQARREGDTREYEG